MAGEAGLLLLLSACWGCWLEAGAAPCPLPASLSPHAQCQLDPWTPCPTEPRDVLRACRCQTTLSLAALQPLRLEYTSLTFGSALVLGDVLGPSSLTHQHGFLTALPDNLCQFPRLVQLDLSHNALARLEPRRLSCLAQLDTLRLSHNLLAWLDEAALAGLARLRQLHLDHNSLVQLDANVIAPSMPFLQEADLSGNLLSVYDMSNADFANPFCQLNLSDNRIVGVVNQLAFPLLDFFNHRGPGRINLKRNNLQNLTILDDAYAERAAGLQGLLDWQMSLTGNPITCDCHIYKWLSMAQMAYSNDSFDDARCSEPAHLAGRPVMTLNPSDLTCNIGALCPLPHCQCAFHAAAARTLIDCRDSALTELPSELPNFLGDGAVGLDLSGSAIRTLDPRPYLRHVTELNVSSTDVTAIPAHTVELLHPNVMLDLSGNRITHLPPALLTKVPARRLLVSLDSLDCHCNLTFLETWLAQVDRGGLLRDSGQCWQQGRRRAAGEVLQECRRPDSTLEVVGGSVGSLAALLLLLTALSYVFRYELAVLAHRMFYRTRLRRACRGSRVQVEKVHDVYVSAGEELLPLVLRELWPRLSRRLGLAVFLPDIHILPGEVTREAQLGALSRSRHVLILASQGWQESEERRAEAAEACQMAFRRWDCDVTLFQAEGEGGPGRGHSNPYLRALGRLGMAHSQLTPQGVEAWLAGRLGARQAGRPEDGGQDRRHAAYVVGIGDVILRG